MNKIDTTKKSNSSYLTFKLGEEDFAVHVTNVLNILELTKITKVPNTPDYMQGVINLRGQVLPVIDTRLKLGMSPIEFTDNTCIIVIEIHLNGDNVYFGSLVDKVEAVYEFDENMIQPPPDLTKQLDDGLIKGITSIEEKFIIVLDIDKLLSVEGDSIIFQDFEKLKAASQV